MKPQSLIATNTLGMGARPGELESCKSDPKGWILAQINSPDDLNDAYREAPSAFDLIAGQRKNRGRMKKNLIEKQDEEAFSERQKSLSAFVAHHNHELALRHQQAVDSQTSFVERWAWFWFNRFTVSARDNHLRMVAGAFEREAIRPHIFGKFGDMLAASTLHPAMIYYLDNVKSVGPNSAFAKMYGGKHNENLGREVLELHTMGVGGGYTIDDITALSYGLTGWTHASPKKGYKTIFKKNRHEREPAIMLGKTYPTHGPEQIHNMLSDLAVHPSTARHIAENLAAHFISGTPPQSAIDALKDNYLKTGGDLKELALCLVELDEVWGQSGWTFKRPDEYIVSVGRALPVWEDHFNPKIAQLLGQPLMQAPGPDGWVQTGEDWVNTENILIRLGWLRRALQSLPSWVNAEFFMEEALGGHVSRKTGEILSKPLLRNELLALGLTSPEFLRR